jgi:glycerophosphoryl diester phosphodiesterase
MRPVVIAHRGASGYLPEHTLPAKALAYAMGADYLEQDIVATRDNALVVLHDIHLDRVSDVAHRFPGRCRRDGRFYVRDFDLSEIKGLAVRERVKPDESPVYPTRFKESEDVFRVHTFAEELEFIRSLVAAHGRQVGIYPEIKRPEWHCAEGVDITPDFLRTLADYGYTEHSDPVYIQCFDAAELRRIRHEFGCRMKLVQLIAEDSWGESATRYAPLRTQKGLERLAKTVDAIGPWLKRAYRLRKRDGRLTPSGLVKRAHLVGLAVHPYTFRADELPMGFDTFDDLLAYFIDELAIDGFFTDFPDLALKFLRRAPGEPGSNG